MFLPISTIIHFRTLSTMIASVEMFNGKRLQARQANKGNGNVQPYERIGMTWADIVLIHSELTEVSAVEGREIRKKLAATMFFTALSHSLHSVYPSLT